MTLCALVKSTKNGFYVKGVSGMVKGLNIVWKNQYAKDILSVLA